MKLKKVLSGFLSAAILATTTSIVMPLEAYATNGTHAIIFEGVVELTSDWAKSVSSPYSSFADGDKLTVTYENARSAQIKFQTQDSSYNWADVDEGGAVHDLTDGANTFVYTIPSSKISDLNTNGNIIIGGKDVTITKIEVNADAASSIDPDTLTPYSLVWEGELKTGNWNGGQQIDAFTCAENDKLTISYAALTDDSLDSYCQIGLKNSLWGDFIHLEMSTGGSERTVTLTAAQAEEFSTNGLVIQGYNATVTSLELNKALKPKPVESVTITGTGVTGTTSKTLALTVGGEAVQLGATVAPDTATDKTVTWSVEPAANGCVTVSNTGLVTIVKEGEATITATAGEKTDTVAVTVNKPAATSVTVTPATLDIKVGGDAAALTAAVKPDDAAQDVVWTSANERIATVSADGKVTAVGTGLVTIFATAKGTTIKGECEVSVSNPATAIAIDKTASVLVGAEKTLAVTTTPEDADAMMYTWTSSKPEVATVTDGVVKGIAAGETVITVTANRNSNLTASCTVTVTAEAKPITDLKISAATLELEEGKTGTLTSTATPADTTDEIEWISSNDKIAAVKDGVVTAVAEGKATITVQVKGNSAISASCEVTVTKKVIAITGVTLDKTTATVEEGKTVTLNATVAPADTTEDKTVTWKSSDETVATVKDGVVTAVKAGTANITATAGGKTATCAVTVTAKAEDPKPSGNALWEGTQDMTWSDSIQIAKEKFADLKAGDTIEITVTKAASGAQISLKSMGEGWPALPAFNKIDPQWGCDNISKADTYKYVMTEDDVKVLKADGMVVGGHDYTVTSVKLVAAAEEPIEKTEYETGKAETVKDYVPKETPAAGTKTELKVNSISTADAAKYSSYDITITVTLKDGTKKTATKSVSDCYKGFTYNNGAANTTVKAAEGFFILVKVKNVPADATVEMSIKGVE